MDKYFKEAFKQAKKAYKRNEVPVGAVIVKNDKIIAKSSNNRQKKHSVIGHAEINCILKASKKIKDWRLDGCIMYVTLEPCDMCKTIIKESRIDEIYYLLSQKNTKNAKKENLRSEITSKYSELLNSFFINLRN